MFSLSPPFIVPQIKQYCLFFRLGFDILRYSPTRYTFRHNPTATPEHVFIRLTTRWQHSSGFHSLRHGFCTEKPGTRPYGRNNHSGGTIYSMTLPGGWRGRKVKISLSFGQTAVFISSVCRRLPNRRHLRNSSGKWRQIRMGRSSGQNTQLLHVPQSVQVHIGRL